jgi:hypothetical protein
MQARTLDRGAKPRGTRMAGVLETIVTPRPGTLHTPARDRYHSIPSPRPLGVPEHGLR